MIIDEDEGVIEHYGVAQRSGRYRYGSHNNVPSGPEKKTHVVGGGTQRNPNFLDMYDGLRKDGLSDTDIAKAMNLTTTEFRDRRTVELARKKLNDIRTAQSYQDKGMGSTEGARRMGIPEPTYRTLLKPGAGDKQRKLVATTDMLRNAVAKDTYIDIGKGQEHYINGGISPEFLRAAASDLELNEGYQIHTINVPQAGTGKDTKNKVLAPPGTTWGDVKRNQDNIKSLTAFTNDGGRSFTEVQAPLAINPKRVAINYKEDGGGKADGIIYLREGQEDLSLGGKRYGQVRVQVGEGHYLKGMAMYKKDMPDGVDIVFNTKKSDTGNKLDAMKPLESDPTLPFGSIIRQIVDKPGDPSAKVTSAMNLVNEEGDWEKWSNTLSSQMLSKQSPTLAKTQLAISYDRRKEDYDTIMSLTNPTVKRKLLEEFADSTDSASVHLKAASMPGQANHVILPLTSIKPGEIYAPGYDNGEHVSLVRFPHGGTFEIPELIVNNRNQEGKKYLGTDSLDAVGIHHKVAERLSGADFDGDTVLVIPNPKGLIKSTPALASLKNFDPMSYKIPDGSPIPKMTVGYKPKAMGDISNLITDMTIKQASHEQIARAVKHSMVVIDAEKHGLDYRQSAIDNGIKELKQEYQGTEGSSKRGASTLISLKGQYKYEPERKLRLQGQGGAIDKETGRKVYVPTNRTRIDKKTGERVLVERKYNVLESTPDAHALSSGTPMEKLYADHSNKLKNLANQARLSTLNTPRLKHSPSAAKAYKPQVDRINAALALAERNAPRERAAQRVARAKVKAYRQDNPDAEQKLLTKLHFKALDEARANLGAGKERIKLSQMEWDAIQQGAISEDRLKRVLANADMDIVRELATPKQKLLMTSNKTQRATQLLANGYTMAEVARDLGVSVSTLNRTINGEEG